MTNKNNDTEHDLTLINEKLIRNEKILIQAYKSLKHKETRLKILNHKLTEREQELQQTNDKLATINQELSTKNDIINKNNIKIKNAFLDLKKTQAKLLQAEKMASLGTLTAGVAHEINNPLNYMMYAFNGFKKYFAQHPTNNDNISYLLKGFKEGLDRATAIVQGLNQFSSSNELINETCNLNNILNNCLTMLTHQLKGRVNVKKEYGENHIIMKGNVSKLHQVFINILENAAQAITTKGIITISLSSSSNFNIIEISDNGIGIARRDIKKLTDPFYTTKLPGEGVGLGLSIAYNIIQEHNGILEFDSFEKKGTTVKVIFPIDIM